MILQLWIKLLLLCWTSQVLHNHWIGALGVQKWQWAACPFSIPKYFISYLWYFMHTWQIIYFFLGLHLESTISEMVLPSRTVDWCWRRRRWWTSKETSNKRYANVIAKAIWFFMPFGRFSLNNCKAMAFFYRIIRVYHFNSAYKILKCKPRLPVN